MSVSLLLIVLLATSMCLEKKLEMVVTFGYAKFGRIVIVFLCLASVPIIANTQRTPQEEVNALQSIKNSFTDPYRNLRNWNRGDPCTTNWTGVICHNLTPTDGYLHITELLLLDKNLSGTLSPELGRFSSMKILDFMWNNISGTIPKEIGNITSLELLLLSGNQLTGSLPEELGKLSNLNRIQVDENRISGPIPLSFANLSKARHIHMNNNSLSGPIPPELSQLPILLHLLLDNNNLSGYLPPELSEITHLLILQLDNNHFSGSTIPSSYGNMTSLLKLSLRNCSLHGDIPNWSNMPNVAYIDLSLNQLNGSIPTGALSRNITVIDLSNNTLNGIIPGSFSELPLLQKLSLANNFLSGSVPSSIWHNRILNASERLILDFTNNEFSNISGSLLTPPNVTIGLQGNSLCSNRTLVQFCRPNEEDLSNSLNITKVNDCSPQLCEPPYEYAPASPGMPCFCAAPLYIGYRLKSPGFFDFLPYFNAFEEELSSGLGLNIHQLDVNSAIWQKGPRLRMHLKIFPTYTNNSLQLINESEVLRIRDLFSGWRIKDNHVFGPFEFLNFTLSDAYEEFLPPSSSGISKGALAGIIVGTIAGSVILSAFVSLLILRRRIHKHHQLSGKRLLSRSSIKIDGVKDFSYSEMAQATNNFDFSSLVGEGGYGKVYRGVLADGKVIAVKRAQEGSLQGENEFLTEIELLSRLHHRNLVSLTGYCDDEGEQMLAYEFVSNGTLRDHLSGKFKVPLNFAMRVRTALDAGRGILYLHTEANPPIFHRDIKSTNILIDSKYTAKVADFGLSKLAPVPEFEGNVPSHISTVVKGTPGYLDPEYFLTHKLTDKSDVYSLGVVFLELLTGMRPISHGKNIVREVNIAYNSGIIFSVIDERMGSYPSECVQKFINLALKCCKDDPDERPSMAQVVRELENIWMMMPEKDTEIITESPMSYPGKEVMTPPSSSSFVTTSYASENVTGRDLISGAIPSVAPR
ncbi:probable LRR receptor-like serine/threonine-protein kinase At1g06840 isoform X2 [Salvia miltiorrhiza]|uniref:probable LRR receptor-like serine/threonine-protein kinase At1g06840 isoform X2 n=1 Tax=Salvia miltiorrhiza TaxID=226208 RepID=UPI0025AB9321|nr:probable LRR receptor-like serine/threonine-protein kinase At1g06840 isoform X2 [Salvia miltiorrhiza]XP_057789772.1 probable LRR receptor-like serine/threonine-protein kinase At1g06840 isoform X2 [Salvia miltiorrhiza]